MEEEAASTQGAAKRVRGDVTEVVASRIYRVKATGGKDRHSKVYTAQGIRDRRVRLSVPTAIQFYDLQDRLGYTQPSKAVEWLINAASAAIDELPPLDPASFAPEHADAGMVKQQQQQQQHAIASKSLCSSASETSQLSLSRSRDKEVTVASTSASFTELLTGMPSAGNPGASEHQQTWQPAPVSNAAAVSFAGNAPPIGMAQPFNFTSSAAQMPTHYPLSVHDTASAPAAGNYNNLDLISMSTSGFLGTANNRGTLQSNSQQHFSDHHHQQLHDQLDGGQSAPFLYQHSAATDQAAAQNHHLTASAALHLWNGFRRHTGMKEKSKN